MTKVPFWLIVFDCLNINVGRSIDNDDEVDDIELILSSDDKEYPQEDLVSISYYEPWQLCGQTGKFLFLKKQVCILDL